MTYSRPSAISWLHFAFLILLGHSVHAAPAKSAPHPPPASPPSFQPHYFFTINLDSRYQIVGTGALTEEQAATANCYYFTYRPDGKIERIEYRRAGISIDDPFFQVPQIDFEYQSGIERRWYRNGEGKPVNDLYKVQGEELTLNAAGFPVDVANMNESGGHIRDSLGVMHYVRTLDEQNRVISTRRVGLLGIVITDNDGYFETHWTYDDQSRPIEYANYDASGNPLNNNEGVAFTRTAWTLFPDTTQTVESYFDASGQPVEEKSSGVHICRSVFDKRGLRISMAYFDATGAPTLDTTNGVHECHYKYDDKGNELSEEFLGTDDQLKDNKKLGYARVVYHYDAKNRVSEKAFFGDDGTPQIVLNVGAAMIRHEYDDQGNLVRRQFFDGNGVPSPHVQYGAPAIRIKVVGDTTYVTLRNDEDKPMKNPIHGYASFSYKTDSEEPLARTNHFYDLQGRQMSLLRVFIINPHLHALRTNTSMRRSARYGAGAAGLGALLAAILALRKASHTKRRKVYVPIPLERFLGWFSVFAMLEGTLRFFITIYWAWVGYQNGRMGPGVFILEGIFIIFFLYRLTRLRVTMRVLNIRREDIDRLIRDFFAKAILKVEWDGDRQIYSTEAMVIRLNYSEAKCHAYLSFSNVNRSDLARSFARYIRSQVGAIQGPPRTKAIAFYYPSVAICYFLLSFTAFYTLWQVLKGQS